MAGTRQLGHNRRWKVIRGSIGSLLVVVCWSSFAGRRLLVVVCRSLLSPVRAVFRWRWCRCSLMFVGHCCCCCATKRRRRAESCQPPISNQQSAISNQQSAISNQQSAISNQQFSNQQFSNSAIQQSAIQQSAIQQSSNPAIQQSSTQHPATSNNIVEQQQRRKKQTNKTEAVTCHMQATAGAGKTATRSMVNLVLLNQLLEHDLQHYVESKPGTIENAKRKLVNVSLHE